MPPISFPFKSRLAPNGGNTSLNSTPVAPVLTLSNFPAEPTYDAGVSDKSFKFVRGESDVQPLAPYNSARPISVL